MYAVKMRYARIGVVDAARLGVGVEEAGELEGCGGGDATDGNGL